MGHHGCSGAHRHGLHIDAPAGYGYGTRFNYTIDHGPILRKDIYILNRHDDI